MQDWYDLPQLLDRLREEPDDYTDKLQVTVHHAFRRGVLTSHEYFAVYLFFVFATAAAAAVGLFFVVGCPTY